MPASICSTFDVVIDQALTAGQTATVTNPGRTLQVVGVTVTGDGDATVTLNKVASGGAVTKIGGATLAASPLSSAVPADMALANSSLVTTDNLQVVVAGGDIREVAFHCIGSPSQALILTVV